MASDGIRQTTERNGEQDASIVSPTHRASSRLSASLTSTLATTLESPIKDDNLTIRVPVNTTASANSAAAASVNTSDTASVPASTTPSTTASDTTGPASNQTASHADSLANSLTSTTPSESRAVSFPPPLDRQQMLRLPSAGTRFQPPQYRRANAGVQSPVGAFAANPLLVGRQHELRALEQLYKNVVAKGGSTMVVVEGKAGTGKSSLVHNASLPDADIFPNSFFVSTMYEPTRSATEPYSALVDAILILVRKILQWEASTQSDGHNSKSNNARIRTANPSSAKRNSLTDFLLQPSVKQDWPLLRKVIPQLWDLAHLNKKHNRHHNRYCSTTKCKLEIAKNAAEARQNISFLSGGAEPPPSSQPRAKTAPPKLAPSIAEAEEVLATTDESTLSADQETDSSMSYNSEEMIRTASLQRLKSVLRKLFAEYCCKPARPVVLHLDNVHHIDYASAELLQSLILTGHCYCERRDNNNNCTSNSNSNNSTASSSGSIDSIPDQDDKHGRSNYFQPNTSKHRDDGKKQQEIHGLLLVLSYRSDDEGKDGIPSNALDNPSGHHRYAPLCQTIQMVMPAKIHLDNLSKDEVHDVFIQLIQQAPNDDTRAMADLLYGKTAGNPYDLSQFLVYLQEHNFLYKDKVNTYKWAWEAPSYINSFTTIPSSQVAIRLARATFKKLNCATKAVLMVASCIGKDVIPVLVIEEFFHAIQTKTALSWDDGKTKTTVSDSEVMERIFSCGGIYVVPPERVVEHLEIAVEHGILVSNSSSRDGQSARSSIRSSKRLSTRSSTSSVTSTTATATYTWSHEKVQEAAYTCLFAKKKTTTTTTNQQQSGAATVKQIGASKMSSIDDEEVATRDQETIHVRLGNLLWRMSVEAETASLSSSLGSSGSSDTQSTDWMVYLAASQLNTVAKRRQENILCYALGIMNLRAAKLSITKSAFYPAVELLQFGITNLPGEERWNPQSKYYDVTLELYTTLAETEYFLGHFEQSQDAIREVMKHATRSCYDTYRVELLQADMAASGLKRDYRRAQTVYVKILQRYGYKRLSKNVGRFRLMRERHKLRRDFPDLTWRDVPNLPTMSVPERDSILLGQQAGSIPSEQEIVIRKAHLLVELLYSAIPTGKWRLGELCGIYLLRIAFEHGFSVHALLPLVFPCIRLKEKRRFKEIFKRTALVVEGKKRIVPNSAEFARISLILHGTVFHLSRPFHDSLDEMTNVHKIFLAVGDMEPAFIASMIYSFCYLSLGLGLAPLESDMTNYHRLAIQFNQPPSLQVLFQIFRQTILNLQGEGYDMQNKPASLVGDAMDEDEVLMQMKESTQYVPTLRDLCSARLMLACVYNDFHAMEMNLDASIAIKFKDAVISRINFRASYTAIAVYALVRASDKGDPSAPQLSKRKRKAFLKVGRDIVKYYEAMVKDGNMNGLPVLLMLKAVNSQDEEAFHKAIVACGRSGLSHFEAIANEQLARLIMRSADSENSFVDQGTVENYLSRALSLYEDWGALGKVLQLKSEFEFLASSRKSRGTTTLKARTRYDSRTSTMLQRVNLADVIPTTAPQPTHEAAPSVPTTVIA